MSFGSAGKLCLLWAWMAVGCIFCVAQEAKPGCQRGYVEVGRQVVDKELIVYCSTVPCDQILTQVKRNFEILGKIEDVEATGDPDLRVWREQKERSEAGAVRAAVDEIDRSILALRSMQLLASVKSIENEQGRLAFAGVAGGGDSRKLLAFKRAVEAWDAAVQGAGRPATSQTAIRSWLAVGDWANALAAKSAALGPAWQAIAGDVATKTVLGKVDVGGAIAAVNRSLEPAVAYRFDRARFFAGYGFDVSEWQGKRRTLLKAKGLPDQAMPAVCRAEKLIAIDLRNENVCLSRLPNVKDTEPEQRQCGAAQ